LDADIWGVCVAGQNHDAAIAEQSQEAIRIGITATPAFVINGRLYEGALSFEQLSGVIIAAEGN
jgi:protein-disulfide isomerase